MNKGKESANRLTSWGNSMLNKLSSITRNRRKRDADKKRRRNGQKEIAKETHNKN